MRRPHGLRLCEEPVGPVQQSTALGLAARERGGPPEQAGARSLSPRSCRSSVTRSPSPSRRASRLECWHRNSASSPGIQERERVLGFRRLIAFTWFLMLGPGGPFAARNPAGTRERQAVRVLELLG
ncbi:hypothetical protein FE391_15075 [Nonomuraea sp. KC401]|nr:MULTISPECIES: hypothetical protein [unclassified Nonomuraea]NBE98349.1 hypothetical protein [Nonomuraea sp. K271]TLF73783.1 hypothetical protein FE391_15075 [Nonomuraea sp. KC401]